MTNNQMLQKYLGPCLDEVMAEMKAAHPRQDFWAEFQEKCIKFNQDESQHERYTAYCTCVVDRLKLKYTTKEAIVEFSKQFSEKPSIIAEDIMGCVQEHQLNPPSEKLKKQ